MARHKNTDWNLTEKPGRTSNGGESYSYNTIKVSLLMDIRDELQRLNSLLRCDNFTRIPYQLNQIRLNTTKRKVKRGN